MNNSLVDFVITFVKFVLVLVVISAIITGYRYLKNTDLYKEELTITNENVLKDEYITHKDDFISDENNPLIGMWYEERTALGTSSTGIHYFANNNVYNHKTIRRYEIESDIKNRPYTYKDGVLQITTYEGKSTKEMSLYKITFLDNDTIAVEPISSRSKETRTLHRYKPNPSDVTNKY